MDLRDTLYNNYNYTSVRNHDELDSQVATNIEYFKAVFLHLIDNKEKQSKILDLACGWGKTIKSLNYFGYKNTFGVDLSKDQTDIAKTELGLSNISCQDIVSYLEESDQKYDVIFAIDIFEHLELDELIKVIRLINEKLENDGLLVLQVPNGNCPIQFQRYSDLTHIRAYNKNSLIQLGLYANLELGYISDVIKTNQSFKNKVRLFFYNVCVKPTMVFFTNVIFGHDCDRIYTSNVVAVYSKIK